MNAIHTLAIHRLVLAGSLLLPTLVLATGCPGNEEQPPVADGEGSDTGPGENTGTTGTDTEPGDETAESTGTDTDTGEEQCVEEPTDPVELLNGCTDATCEPFANTPDRLPRLNTDGSLPPLP
jgi:hypothetical protein